MNTGVEKKGKGGHIYPKGATKGETLKIKYRYGLSQISK